MNNGKTSQYKEIDSKENKIEVKDKNDSTITINSSILTMLPEKLDQTKTSANANSNFVTWIINVNKTKLELQISPNKIETLSGLSLLS